MAENRELQILITAKEDASKKLEGINNRLEKLEPTFRKMRNAGAVAFGAITTEFGLALKAFSDSEAQMAKVNAILDTLPASASKAMGGLDGLKKSIEGVSQANIKLAFDDEDTAESIGKLIQATGDYEKALKLNQLAMDLARFKGIGLSEATSTLIKVQAGQTRVLKELGIEVDENATAEDAYRIVMEKTAGQAKAYADTVVGKTEAMKISFANLQEGIGQALAPAFTKLTETVMPVILRFSEWASKNPELLSKLILIGGAIAGLTTVIGVIGMVLPSIIAGFSALGVVFGILLGPIGLVIIAIGALIAIGVLLYKHWDDISAFAMKIWGRIADFFSGVWETIKNIFSFSVAFILGLVITAFDAMGIDIIAVVGTIKTALVVAWDFLSALFDKISQAIVKGFEFLKGIFKTATKPLLDAWNGLWNSIGGTVVSVWDGIKNTVKNSINWIIEKINGFIKKVNDIAKAGNVIPGVSVPQIPSIPLLAKGGIVDSPTLAMIGEAGPEAVVPLNKSGMFGRGITINISGNTVVGRNGMDEFVKLISESLVSQLNFNMK